MPDSEYEIREKITIKRLIAFIFHDEAISNPYEGLAMFKKAY